ncbi:MAG: GSU2403 family nucleotidyltransferase fold protein [Syntrophobacteraceae bacterium]
MVLEDVLKESREYYFSRKRKLTAAVLGIPRGSVKQKVIRGKGYNYLHVRSGYKIKDVYLGKVSSDSLNTIQKQLIKRKQLLKEIAVARTSLKAIGVSKHMIESHDFSEPIQKLFQKLIDLGLWDFGLELVGSWCFKVYQNYMGVEFYPFVTLDIDLAIPVSYKGQDVDLGNLLEDLGFTLNFRPNGAMIYEGFGLIVEFLSPDKGKGAPDGKINVEGLKVSSLALRYLDILMDNSISICIRQVGKISVPSLPAFFVHKLLVAPLRKEGGKKEKDYMQINAIAKRILQQDELVSESSRILAHLPSSWIKKIKSSAHLMEKYLPPDKPDAASVLLSRIGA